ncbi:MAG: hypothetical protein ACJ72S_12235 [Nitrososphaeraceae archaeon]
MSFGVDVLGTLSEKLKHMFDETQGKYSTFMNDNKLHKEQVIDEKEFFLRITDYLVNLSAFNFLAIRVVLELKSAMEKGTSIKDTSGGFASPPASQQLSFGVGGFINTGGSAGINDKSSEEQLQLPSFKPVDIEIERHQSTIPEKGSINNTTRRCTACGVIISREAKFCSKCGNLQ